MGLCTISVLEQVQKCSVILNYYPTYLPHNLIKDKLMDLIERTFQKEGSLYIACNDRNAFFISDAVRNYNLWSCQKVCEALTFLLDNIYIRFGSKLYRQIVVFIWVLPVPLL